MSADTNGPATERLSEEVRHFLNVNQHLSGVCSLIKNLQAEIDRLRALPPPVNGWRPIETAPKSGIVILRRPFQVWPGYWNTDRWSGTPHKDSAQPTHWQPLPSPDLTPAAPTPPAPEEGSKEEVLSDDALGSDKWRTTPVKDWTPTDWLTVLMRCQNGEATCMFIMEKILELEQSRTPDTSLPPLTAGPRRKMLVEIEVGADFEKRLDNQWEVEREINADRWNWKWAPPVEAVTPESIAAIRADLKVRIDVDCGKVKPTEITKEERKPDDMDRHVAAIILKVSSRSTPEQWEAVTVAAKEIAQYRADCIDTVAEPLRREVEEANDNLEGLRQMYAEAVRSVAGFRTSLGHSRERCAELENLIDARRIDIAAAQAERDDARDALQTALDSKTCEAMELREALVQVKNFFGYGEGSNEYFERQGEAFYRATGMLRPGKDQPMAAADHTDEERFETHKKWQDAQYNAMRQAVPAALARTDYSLWLPVLRTTFQELEKDRARLEETRIALTEIKALSKGWDVYGSTGPREPLSWESVARLAMDYAFAALASGDPKGEKA